MLVDPSTGEPISLSTTALDMGAGSSAGFATSQAAMGMGAEPGGRFVEAFSKMPAASHVMGWNALRGSQTIIGGARSAREMKSGIKASMNVTLNPKHWLRMPNYASLDTASRGEHGYTPFQMLSGKFANKSANKLARRSSTLQKMLTPSQLEDLKGGKNIDMVGGGFLSRLTASARIGWSSPKGQVKLQKNIAKFISGSGEKDLYSGLSGVLGKNFENATIGDLGHAQMSTMRGAASQYVGGYFSGSMFGSEGAAYDHLIQSGLKKNYVKGVERAAEHLGSAGLKRSGGRFVVDEASHIGRQLIDKDILKAGEKIGMRHLGRIAGTEVTKLGAEAGAEVVEKVGTKAAMKAGLAMGAERLGMFIPGVNVVMTAMMVHDLTEMGISLAKGGMEFGKEGMKSFQGSLYKPVMGMGYRDTEVAATSRQRGTMAIQNSRLNARSVLGNEASGMAAHFG